MCDKMNDLVEKHYNRAISVAKKYARRYNIDVDKATNTAIERLIKCANNGDKVNDTKIPFEGYVEKSIRLDMMHILHLRKKMINAGEHVELEAARPAHEVLESVPYVSFLFDFKHRQIFESKRTGATQQAIGNAYGVTKKRIQIVQKRIVGFLTTLVSFLS